MKLRRLRSEILKLTPEFLIFWPFLVMASACGHLGRRTEAAAAVRDLLALDPEFAAHARSNIGSWHFASGLFEPILEGLREAGLEIPAAKGGGHACASRAVGDRPGRTGRLNVKSSP